LPKIELPPARDSCPHIAWAARIAGTGRQAFTLAKYCIGSSTQNTKQMIEQMAAKGLWTSPGGATPWATLYSAILREIQVKGKEARFKKTDRGHSAANA
jgi:hypothetical protein